MKICILGAGLIGLSTAYELEKLGHKVTIIDRNEGPGEECSYSNGGQLSYCHAEPWSSYSSLLKAIKWIGKNDAPLLFKPSLDLDMWKWLMQFVSYAGKKPNLLNTEKILKLGLYSRKRLHEIEKDLNFDFNYEKGGKIFLFKTKECFDTYIKQARRQELLGSEYQILSPKETLDYEPALIDKIQDVYSCIRDPLDESADAYKYCVGLSNQLQKRGVDFRYSTDIKEIKLNEKNSEIKSVIVGEDEEEITSDLFIMCLGTFSPIFAKKIGIKLPIYPIKGYSISVDIGENEIGSKNSITDHHEKIVYSGIGENKMRVAGTAEFAGYNTSITPERIKMLKESTARLFPKLKNIENASSWACLRPSTPDGPPIIEKSDKIENLILNTGHGTLGWTQSFASAKLTADIIENTETELDINWFSSKRYKLNF